jgi:hypothetical protein
MGCVYILHLRTKKYDFYPNRIIKIDNYLRLENFWKTRLCKKFALAYKKIDLPITPKFYARDGIRTH